jgi:hypothetical protein
MIDFITDISLEHIPYGYSSWHYIGMTFTGLSGGHLSMLAALGLEDHCVAICW